MPDSRPTLVPDTYNGSATYLMPPFFGALPFPLPPSRYRDTTNLTFAYDTDGDALRRLLPPRFRLTDNKLIISVINNRGVDWLAGGAYNLLAVNIPVSFEGEEQETEGVLGLVVWENKAAPILMGREVQGVPKLFAEVSELREFPDTLFSATAHYEGCRFARVAMSARETLSGDLLEQVKTERSRANWFGWRCFPNVGSPGVVVSHPVLFPQEFNIWSATVGSATIEWTPPDWASNPTQAGIITALAALPNLGGGEALLMRCENILRADLAHIPR